MIMNFKCGYCGNENLEETNITYEFHCPNCDTEFSLNELDSEEIKNKTIEGLKNEARELRNAIYLFLEHPNNNDICRLNPSLKILEDAINNSKLKNSSLWDNFERRK